MALSVLNEDVNLNIHIARSQGREFTDAFTINSTDALYVEGSGAYTIQYLSFLGVWEDTTFTGTLTASRVQVPGIASLVPISISPNNVRVATVSGDCTATIISAIQVWQSVPLGGLYAPSDALWTPLDEPSLLLWMDGSDASTVTLDGNSKIIEWRSKVGGHGYVPETLAGATLENGYVDFPLGDNYAMGSDTRLGLSPDPEMLVVASGTPYDTATTLLFEVGDSAGRPYVIFSQTEYAWRYGNGNCLFPPTNGANQVLISAIRQPGVRANNRMRADGEELTSIGFVEGSTAATEVDSSIGRVWHGRIDQLLVFSDTSQSVIDKAEGWTAHRTGRQGELPANHPYRNSPPTVSSGVVYTWETLWNTENPGTSASDSIDIPLISAATYDAVVYWGDGNTTAVVGTGLTSVSHTYSVSGIKAVNISGTFPGPHFNNGGDDLKLLRVDKGGILPLPEETFFGASNLIDLALIDTSQGINFTRAWRGCTGLTSFPLIDTSQGEVFTNTWFGCAGLTSFPLLDTSKGKNFFNTWRSCTGLTSFPLIDTSQSTGFISTWQNCTSLVSFPLLDTSKGGDFSSAWRDCSSLVSFPLIATTQSTKFSNTWRNCSSLVSFPAGVFDTCTHAAFGNAFLGCTSLSSTSVDNILISIDTAGQSNGLLHVDGAVPSVAGVAALASLRGKGWTVTGTGAPTP